MFIIWLYCIISAEITSLLFSRSLYHILTGDSKSHKTFFYVSDQKICNSDLLKSFLDCLYKNWTIKLWSNSKSTLRTEQVAQISWWYSVDVLQFWLNLTSLLGTILRSLDLCWNCRNPDKMLNNIYLHTLWS